MKTVPTILLGSLLLAACNDPPQGPSPAPDFRVAPMQQWSGGEVTVVSSYFIDHATIPPFKIDSFSVQPVRLDDSTVSLRLPSLPSGAFDLFVKDPGILFAVGQVQIAGFRVRRLLPPTYDARLSAYRTAVGTLIVGAGTSSLQGLNLATGSAFSYPGLSTTTYGPSPSYLGSDVVVVLDSTFIPRQYRIGATAELVDSTPLGPQYSLGRHLATFSPDIQLISGSHESYTITAGVYRFFSTESVYSIFLSPRGDRAVLALSVGTPGDEVFDMATGDTAYTLPIRSVYGAAFSDDGAGLFASGGSQWYLHNQLVSVDASTGAILARDSISDAHTSFFAVALNHAGTRLFVITTEQDTLPVLRVYDSNTLKLLSRLSVPLGETVPCHFGCWQSIVVLDETRRTAYFATPGDPTVSYEFDILDQ